MNRTVISLEHLVEHAIRKHRQRFLDSKFQRLEISTPQGFYLMRVSEHQKVKLNQLIEQSPFHKSHVTRQIQQLASRDLVQKTIDPDDNRGFIVAITPSGEKMVQAVKRALQDWDDLCASALTEQERLDLHKIQSKILAHVEMTFKEDYNIE